MSTHQKIILKYATTLLFFVPVFVSAQQVLEEIIVTAQKRAESVQDVPIAISAFAGEQIEELAIGDLRELIEFIPGVEMYDDRGISSQPTWIIRGVGLADLNANNTPTAAIYHDEFYLTSNIMGGIGMFDIERIEVLKGAQGGLYGRNTTGGAVRVESVKPDLEGANGYASGSYGRYDAWSLEGAMGVPMGERAAFRIAALTNQGGGYQDSLATAVDDNYADRDYWALRGQLLFEPSADLSILFKVEAGEDNSEILLGHGVGWLDPVNPFTLTGPQPCAPALAGRQDNNQCITIAPLVNGILGREGGATVADQSGDGKRVTTSPVNEMDNDWLSFNGRIDWDLGAATLTSITGYIDYTNKQLHDYDASALALAHEVNTSPIEAWSQELRLISNDAGAPLSWLAGFLYAEDELNELRFFVFQDHALVHAGGFGGLPVHSFQRGFDQKTEAWSVYGQVGYRFTEQWKVHGSLRYTDESKELSNGLFVFRLTPEIPLPPVVGPGTSKSYDLGKNWSGHFGIDWTPTDAALLYAKVSRGTKSGGFFGGFVTDESALNAYTEETLWAWEIGFKSDWLAQTLRLNGTAFYYDYTDVQSVHAVFNETAGSPVPTVANVADAEHLGVELDLTWLPPALPGFSVSGALAWLDTELDSDLSFDSEDGTTVPYNGLERIFAPDFSYSLTGRYERALTDNLAGYAQLTWSWRNDLRHLDNAGTLFEAAMLGIADYGILNARVQVGAQDGRWSVAFVGKNLTDKAYLASTVPSGLMGFSNTYGRPLSWAIELTAHWE